jgi:Met-10+ like-protein
MMLTKGLARTILPGWSWSGLRSCRNWWRRYRIRRARVVEPIARRLGFVVQSGPFAGMVYPREIVRADIGSVFFPKLVGCYEMECHPFIERMCSQAYDRIINIGAGDGYYAVGLARRLSKSQVIAFELDPRSRELCRRLAQMNGVQSRVEVRGLCDRDALASSLAGRTAIVCDCEGAEIDLLQPDKIRALSQTDLLVELHDFVSAEISQTIRSRFELTHDLELTQSRERDPRAWPFLSGLPRRDQAFLLSEHRPCSMEWLFAQPIDSASRETTLMGSPDYVGGSGV